MSHHTTPGRALAILAGVAFAYGSLRIILGDTLLDLSKWTTSTQLTVLAVFGTIAAGHLFNDARRAHHWLACFGFIVLFVAGTGLVVFNSVGRQAESSMLTVAQSEDAAERRIDVKAALKRSQAMLTKTSDKLHTDCVVGKKGKRHCDGLRASVEVYTAAVKGHNADLTEIGPPKPVNAKATQAAKIAAMFGFDQERAKAALLLVEPFLWTMFFEIGSIVSLGFAFRGSQPHPARASAPVKPQKTSAPDVVPTPQPDALNTTNGGKKVMVLCEITGKSFGSQREMQDHLTENGLATARSTLSDWLNEWEEQGLIPPRQAEGRTKALVGA